MEERLGMGGIKHNSFYLGVGGSLCGNTTIFRFRQANLVWRATTTYVTLPFKGYSASNDGIIIPILSNLGYIQLIVSNYTVAYQGWSVLSNLVNGVSGFQMNRDSSTEILRISITSNYGANEFFYIPYFIYFCPNDTHIDEYLNMPFGAY